MLGFFTKTDLILCSRLFLALFSISTKTLIFVWVKNNIWSEVESNVVGLEGKKTSNYWFQQVVFSHQEKKAVLTVPSLFVKDSFEKKFGPKVSSELINKGFVDGFVYVVDPNLFPEKKLEDLDLKIKKGVEEVVFEKEGSSNFDLSVFERFCTGSSNNLAVVAAKTVVEKPGERFNPLFLYGRPGVGKTYLLKTIEKTRDDTLYIGSEDFLNSFIQGIKNKDLEIFKKKIRNNKILLFDDVQFLVGKKAASEEFLNTVNHYIEEKQAIVLVSDVKPEELSGFPERLISRIYSGLVTDIEKPGKDVLFSYLRKKDKKMGLGEELVSKISSYPFNNFRELNGFLNRFSVGVSANSDVVSFVEGFLIGNPQSFLEKKSPEELLLFVSEKYQIDKDLLVSKNRTEVVVKARHILIALLRKNTSLSLNQIGLFLGGRSHSTILSSLKKVEGNKELSTDLDKIVLEQKVG